MGRRVAAVAVMALLALWGSSAVASLRYDRAVRMATHNGRLYNFETWDAKIIWHATFFTDRFRRAFERRHIEVNHLDPEEANPFVAEQEHRQSQGWDVIVSSYTKKDYRTFSLSHDSFWKAKLTTSSGETVAPREIESIPVTPYAKAMYPHLTRWSKLYRVTFPKVDLGREFSMTIQSVVGGSTLSWREGEKEKSERRRR